jgi:hypothetical protein
VKSFSVPLRNEVVTFRLAPMVGPVRSAGSRRRPHCLHWPAPSDHDAGIAPEEGPCSLPEAKVANPADRPRRSALRLCCHPVVRRATASQHRSQFDLSRIISAGAWRVLVALVHVVDFAPEMGSGNWRRHSDCSGISCRAGSTCRYGPSCQGRPPAGHSDRPRRQCNWRCLSAM